MAKESLRDPWDLYERKRPPNISWDLAKVAITTGQPQGDYFTLPWFLCERSTKGCLWGAHHNAGRAHKLMQSEPDGVTEDGRPWYIGILYSGAPDEYLEKPVGVVTRTGHVGCLPPEASTGGIDTFVRKRAHGYSYFCVPVVHAGIVPMPYGPDVSPFDNPWGARDSGGLTDWGPTWRINRSHLIAIHLAKHGPGEAWRTIAEGLSRLRSEHGVTVLQPIELPLGGEVVNNVRGAVGADFLDRFCSLTGLTTTRAVSGQTTAVVTRYLHSESRACRDARAAGIPIFRTDEFAGRVAEWLWSSTTR
ncbi:hypothetical protein Rhe02_83980 [Rhizocola hellebori]|uniref:Uncharacterized protein n=1 Tax=Rhizocola hellebori TaxID=1392758 RepID=A0A8J3VLQ4_9ACTN|nr:hypothetical protein Rhe02_83980 [Rhizocola hellebori]